MVTFVTSLAFVWFIWLLSFPALTLQSYLHETIPHLIGSEQMIFISNTFIQEEFF